MDIPDGQGGIIAAILTAAGVVATALRLGLGRVAKSFEDQGAAFKALTDKSQTTTETLIRVEGTVQEGREDIREVRAIAERMERRPRRRDSSPALPKRATTEGK